jgi:3-methylcrotonyl-CoA carboxylase alpha subunit
MLFHKVLIANRGEIAIRVMRACRELGIATVSVYSEADRNALHVALADESVFIGAAAAAESYLNIKRIVAAAQDCGCDALHPGYGFLSENQDFAQAVLDAGIVFIGPQPAAMRAMASKTSARALMRQAGVPVVPGVETLHAVTPGVHAASALTDADALGYPLIIKAAGGGGGKGMRVIHSAAELPEALDSAQREAQNAFGEPAVYFERYLPSPHHIELQILADRHGSTLHLLERECSIQRRHQKIIEETPSPLLTPALRARMGEAAVSAARAVGYVNAGTVEFLVDDDRNFYFLEMNTRLQVEHAITETLTGIDLVKSQIRVAAGEPLRLRQADIVGRGHAIECRIYAEDPETGFLPSTGTILAYEEPRGPGIRVDSGFALGRSVSRFYDPLIAKVIVSAETRPDAIARMDQALAQYTIVGLTTNIRFLRDLLAHQAFRAGDTPTSFIAEHFARWAPPIYGVPDEVLVAAALSETIEPPVTAQAADGDAFNPWHRPDRFRAGASFDPKIAF